MTNKELQAILSKLPDDAQMLFYWVYDCADHWYSMDADERISEIDVRYCVPPYDRSETKDKPFDQSQCYLILKGEEEDDE